MENRTARQVPDPMYMLAFDHRKVLRDLYAEADTASLQSAKSIVLDALAALPEFPSNSLAYLVDEEYGAEAARQARDRGHYLAMPIEASRTKILQLQYPQDYKERFTRFDPHCVKALVFHNPADDTDRKKEQVRLLREIESFARSQDRDFLLEVLITPTDDQLRDCAGDKTTFRTDLFPRLLVESIAELQDEGIEPDIWKVEGLASTQETMEVATQATSQGRSHVRCVVLGSGESQETVSQWLANASTVPAFSGFAIGRTVWHQPIADVFSGKISREESVTTMADTFRSLISEFARGRATDSLRS